MAHPRSSSLQRSSCSVPGRTSSDVEAFPHRHEAQLRGVIRVRRIGAAIDPDLPAFYILGRQRSGEARDECEKINASKHVQSPVSAHYVVSSDAYKVATGTVAMGELADQPRRKEGTNVVITHTGARYSLHDACPHYTPVTR